MFNGAYTALITPYKDNFIDENALGKIIDWQLQHGIQGFVVCGTTGENTALSHDERNQVIKAVIRHTNNRVPVIVGCGSASTHEATQYLKEAKEFGANGALIVCPYYVKPTQEGLFNHFKTIHDAVDLPIILYNNQGRTVANLNLDTIQKLSLLSNIIGIKESSTDLQHIHLLRQSIQKDFCIFSGEDSVSPAHLMYGCDGIISFSSNAVPGLCRRLIDAYIQKDFVHFQKLSQDWVDLAIAIGSDVNPCGAKYAAHLLDLCSDEIRLPLLLAKEKCRNNIENKISLIKLYNNS